MKQYHIQTLTAALLLVLAGTFISCTSSRKAVKSQEVNTVVRQQLTPEQQRKYEYFFLEATRMRAQNEYDAAFELYKRCLEIDPNAPSALYEISQYYQHLGQPELGLESLKRAATYAPNNYWYSQALASFYQQQEKTDESIALLESMVVRFPAKQEPLFALMELYGKQQNYEKMISTLNRIENAIGKNEQISLEKFRIYLQMKDDKKAFEEIDNLVKEYPLDMRYLTVQGDVYLQNGKKEEAYEIYKKALAREPNNPLAQISLATYYDAINEKELYYQQLDTILLNKEVGTDLKLSLMRQFIVGDAQSRKDSTEIISMFERLIEQDSEDTEIPMLYTQYLISKKMEDQTVPVLEHILSLDPTNTAARMTLLGTAIRKNDYAWVIRICKTGTEVSPETIEFYFYLGIAYYQEKQYEEALATYTEALQHVTDQTDKAVISDFYSMIGDIQHTRKQMKEAYAAYDSALVYNPSNIGALNNYAYYLSLERRDLDRAEEMSYKTVKAEPNNSTYLDTYAWILFEKGDYVQARLFIDDALKSDAEASDVIIEHAGDIYFMNGDVDGAVKLWLQAKEKGSESKTLEQKIKKKKYIPDEN
ncbi:lipopolysaccharide assembly protein LapB [Bacteroides sp. 51]|uniref:tetratricopeptide repeat protein n=1 Tax=Bacteroides sp. 51 TaxID=2302938 RepID=UPI0013D30388|nr:tetratricopeptide repeat protein [Bacteroides sp. 51]NDV84710.1 tetratricopeptide repeat protein [Bacteroides sp. 51]